MLTLQQRLDKLYTVADDIQQGRLTFNPNKAKFGMVNFDKLFDVDLQEEIKGYPCVAYNHMSDPIKFGIKVNPLENKYNAKNHPCRIEAKLLREFTKCVTDGITPHITYYFWDMDVLNTQNAITKFPLKLMRNDIHKMCSVLISEFVPGGSIEDWVQRVEPTLDQWRYIIFAAVWTLVVLQDKYRFMHRDFHFGNMLIDNSIDSNDKTVLAYRLELGDGQSTSWYVQNCGILPKIWDFEFGNVYKNMDLAVNKFGNWGDSMPLEFNPYYDIHFFLTTLLELSLPVQVHEFILSLYPTELIPDMGHSTNCSTCSTTTTFSISTKSTATSTNESVNIDTVSQFTNSEWDDYSDTSSQSSSTTVPSTTDLSFHDIYYITDEDDSLSQHTVLSDSNNTNSVSSCVDESGSSRSSRSPRTSFTSTTTTSSESCRGVKTEYLAGDRMRSGAHLKFQEHLPTPLTLLTHDFFKCYRRNKINAGSSDLVMFQYKLTSKIDQLR